MRPTAGITFGGRYELQSRIAIGGMGEVWQATDLVIGRLVAIKILKDEYLGDPGFLERFRAEARHAALVNHEGIANVYDYGEEEGSAYLVMELVPGEPLSAVIEREKTLSIDKVLDIIAQTSAALQAAHSAGLVHRDIKPGNIMVDLAKGAVKVMDFGVARVADAARTRTGVVLGTPTFMSPEQLSGQVIDGRSDLYSLGVTLFQLLTGQLPYRNDSMATLMRAISREKVPNVCELRPELPPALGDIVALALEKHPNTRYANGRQMADDLRAVAVRLTPPVLA